MYNIIPQNQPGQYLNNYMQQNMEDFYRRYYPDLETDEIGLDRSTQNNLLFNRKKFTQLAKYGADKNCEMTYYQIKENNDFKELAASKYLNSAQGFVRLVSTMDSLNAQRAEKIIKPYSQYANVLYYNPIPYEKYNINDYLRLLNNFVKNPKISEDLKQYFLAMKADKIDVYYTRLDKLDKSTNPIITLTENLSYSKE